MKVLSLKQPFAELVVSGKKTIEIRKWNTKFRGEFLIHASKNADKEAMIKHGYENLPCGVIVGKAKLVSVKKYSDEIDFKKDQDKHLASSDYGNYGFMLEDAERIKEIPAKGRLGFWGFSK
jgi:predicted transcriptional regulator